MRAVVLTVLLLAGGAAAADPRGQSWSLYTGKYTADPLPDHILRVQHITFDPARIRRSPASTGPT